ncbi:RNA-guided endonuclease InsQ/TnpB family protein [Sporolactobacillus laevolacticus]|uniref:Transposase IS200 n=1 Tax=Sporolactobacillus laevolacticus DSM 442 TaxID=1395513 RepID=V6J3D4_9BACL|nr:RNA-guided endonuclease TnpB family protein [Sporolactobacillus laevolacticus]EST11214.1 transposase IS200 [Sporolactobacillus laevolacticus DSM 442]
MKGKMPDKQKIAIKERMAEVKEQFKYVSGFRVRVYPSAQQADIMRFNANTSRYIYNALVFREWSTKKHAKWLNNDKRLDTNMPSLANAAYQSAWNRWRKVNNAGTPKPKRKDSYRLSYQTKNSYVAKARIAGYDIFNGSKVRVVDSHHIQIPKVNVLKASANNIKHLPREKGIRIGITTIKQEPNGNWFISFQVKSDHPFKEKLVKTNKAVGIDLNLSNFLTQSDGKVVENPHFYKRIKGQIAKAQRVVSKRAVRAKKEKRALRNSKNYQKARLRLSELQNKVARQRLDFLHNVSTTLIKNHDVVVSEELRGKNLLKNHALAMSISDVGWRTLINQLDYKAKLYGRIYLPVNPAYTTKTCHVCGEINHNVKLGMEEWMCPHCCTFHIRDHNAAINIKRKGLLILSKTGAVATSES